MRRNDDAAASKKCKERSNSKKRKRVVRHTFISNGCRVIYRFIMGGNIFAVSFTLGGGETCIFIDMKRFGSGRGQYV